MNEYPNSQLGQLPGSPGQSPCKGNEGSDEDRGYDRRQPAPDSRDSDIDLMIPAQGMQEVGPLPGQREVAQHAEAKQDAAEEGNGETPQLAGTHDNLLT